MKHVRFIQKDQVFERCRELVDNALLIERRLPNQVFQEGFGHFVFEEFDWAMSNEFWPAIQKLSKFSGDLSLLIAVLDPDPENYYRSEFGYFNWAELKVAESANEYWNLLQDHPEGSPADAILSNSETIVWLPLSGRWAIWGERGRGVCVLGFRKEETPPNELIGSWRNVDDALVTLLPHNFKDAHVPREFFETLRSNFGRSL